MPKPKPLAPPRKGMPTYDPEGVNRQYGFTEQMDASPEELARRRELVRRATASNVEKTRQSKMMKASVKKTQQALREKLAARTAAEKAGKAARAAGRIGKRVGGKLGIAGTLLTGAQMGIQVYKAEQRRKKRQTPEI